jgi:hypothetical protein
LLFFTENLGVFRFFPVFSFFGFFSVCFGCFTSIPKQRVSMFRLNRNKQKTHQNTLKESIFGYFSENLGLFRFVTKQSCLFRLFRYRFETNRNFFFVFTKQIETNANQILFRFVSVRTEIYFCLFRGHPTSVHVVYLYPLFTVSSVFSPGVCVFYAKSLITVSSITVLSFVRRLGTQTQTQTRNSDSDSD